MAQAVLFIVTMAVAGVALCFQRISILLHLDPDAAIQIGGSLVSGAVISGAVFLFEQRMGREQKQREEALRRGEREQDLRRQEQELHRQFLMQLSLERDLRGINLDGRQLPQVFLRHKKLCDASMHKINLTDGDISFSDLSGANLAEAILPGARANHETLLIGARLNGANLDGVTFPEVCAPGVNLSGASAQHASFKGADFSGARFSGANLKFADFSEATLRGCDFRRADIRGINLRGADLTDAKGLPPPND